MAGLALGLVGLLGLVALYRFDPAVSSWFPPCPFHALTGLHCPGCGTLRALHRLAHGDVGGALAMNPLLFVGLPAMAVLLAWPRLARHRAVPLACLIVLLTYAVLRNLPWWPFSLLAPH